MRTTATGFILGYAVIAFVIAPSLLYASGAAPNYGRGVVMVLDRTGMLELSRRGARQAVEFRDHAMQLLDSFLDRRVVPYLLPVED